MEQIISPGSIDSGLLDIIALHALLLGIYTAIYFGTLYIYLKSKLARNLWVISAITALYLLNVEQLAVEWSWAHIHSTDAATAFSTTGLNYINLISNINAFLLGLIADTLLIWRCYNVWNGSICIILMPSALLLLEMGVGITNIVKIAADHSNEGVLLIKTSLAIISACALTVLTTTLILYRIIMVSRHTSLTQRTQNNCKAIVDMVVQSSAVYSAVLLIWVISHVTTAQIPASEVAMLGMDELTFIVTGMAPTVMVARIAHVRSRDLNQENLTTCTTDLEFRAGTTHVTVSALGSER
ncbi:hypothetical protein HYPSUDRAFT_201100 [Hypholoma sublateritium FD-334 SS-4]|uniref:Uncharacterized protein n=1 Tax=Hypholoma sublateritium (strain FD-334 SS-4) TaxID=945553 RepID=A0A0D2NY35_HYPSF|nr:hypothetical protein HYPSUDRAFT_201100 [Hypholoma sublateritium FD-334 SS-4]